MTITLESDDLDSALNHPMVRGLLESISDGVLVIDAKSRNILKMNATARQLLGYGEAEVMSCQCRKAMNSPACTLSCPLTSLLEGDKAGGELDLYYRGMGGEQLLHAHTKMLLLRGPSGAPLAGVEIFQDLREVRALKAQLKTRRGLSGMAGSSPPMQALFDQIEELAPYNIPVLIRGESGVGKERVADALHGLSRVADGPLIKVNCGALPEALAQSELFGHTSGAFTGARRGRLGRFQEADGGTLFLDEIADLPLPLQATLLRALQSGEVQPLGQAGTQRVSVRLIAATHQDLEAAIAAGRFREDLYYRIAGATLSVPPLRERREDIPLIAAALLRRFAKVQGLGATPSLSTESLALLSQAPWPGNIRQLRHALELGVIRAGDGGVIEAGHLPDLGRGQVSTQKAPVRAVPRPLAEIEKEAIDAAIRYFNGNLSAAARALGINRSTLWRKCQRQLGE